jgi:PAS domain S-box-containing protein
MSRADDEPRALIESIPALAWSASPDGPALSFNRRWLDYTGRTAEEAMGGGWKVAVHPDDLPKMLEVFQNALDTGRPFDAEGRLRRVDGEYRRFLFRGDPVLDESGTVVKWYGTNIDLEDRTRADALRQSEQIFRTTIDSIPGLVAIMTAEVGIEWANRRFLEYFGKTLDELRDWGTGSLVHPNDLPNVMAAWTHSVESGTPYEAEHRLLRADGAYRWFASRGLPLRDDSGRIVRWHNLLTDIDDRKQLEERLRRSEADFLEAQRLSHTGSWRHDLLSGTLTVSPEVLRMYGLQSDDRLSTIEALYDGIHPDDRSMVRQAYESAQAQKADFVADYRIDLRDGTIEYLHTVGHPVLNASGEVVEYVGFGMDVTQQRLASAGLEAAFEEIKRLKDQLQDENVALRERSIRRSCSRRLSAHRQF